MNVVQGGVLAAVRPFAHVARFLKRALHLAEAIGELCRLNKKL
jgi:hypothetical protein